VKLRGQRSRGGKPATRRGFEGGELVRLQKALAAAGIGSRRQCEELIREGRVDVDGQTVTELGTRVDPARQQIRVDGEAVRRPKRRLYFLVNKPIGILSTSNDPSGRPRVIDFAPTNERLFTVGRLDKSSEGLILVTNDGELTDLLTHPRYGVEKAYLAEVAGVPTAEAIEKLRRGVHLAEGFAHAKRVILKRTHRHSAVLEIVLDEGRNREVRRLLARIGHKVLKLRRTAIGPLRLGNLQPGESRPLRADEIEELYRAAREGRRAKKHERRGEPANHPKASQAGEAESSAGVHPVIDRSLPPKAWDDDESREFAADGLTVSESDPEELTSDAFDDQFEDSSSDKPAAPVDLRPFSLGQSRKPRQATIIGGGDDRTSDRPRHKRRHRGRPHGGSDGRKRRRK
jgi:23S rRNA pseudouridine2605 synthase